MTIGISVEKSNAVNLPRFSLVNRKCFCFQTYEKKKHCSAVFDLIVYYCQWKSMHWNKKKKRKNWGNNIEWCVFWIRVSLQPAKNYLTLAGWRISKINWKSVCLNWRMNEFSWASYQMASSNIWWTSKVTENDWKKVCVWMSDSFISS